ncbi:hypothetical protein B6F84_00155 [Acidianus manzaensis]|uniref:Uncharacterized protein n=2 Tax=Acidianus manzaensis TaxID=282676 RepID=A0A1W6JWH4_9CREN|nr:hypothetical protein B6F84_00155 [Acidianus manzaensis]
MLSFLNSKYIKELESIVSRDLASTSPDDIPKFLEEVLRRYLDGERDLEKIVNAGLLKIRVFEKLNKINISPNIYKDIGEELRRVPEQELKTVFVYYFISNRSNLNKKK